jgi:uncharacterized protein DUF177 involved in 23S rRNA accumulation
MSKGSAMIDKQSPWSVPIVVAQIPDTGLHRNIEAGAAERDAIAAIGDLREVLSVSASFDVMPIGQGRISVVGSVKGRIGQTCVVTLDPIENDLNETIDLIFAPESQIPQLADLVDEAAAGEADVPDPPEPILNGIIDLGRVATDALFLGVDPYPRKPDAVFELPAIPEDPEDHPFAALKALRVDSEAADPNKPKRRR